MPHKQGKAMQYRQGEEVHVIYGKNYLKRDFSEAAIGDNFLALFYFKETPGKTELQEYKKTSNSKAKSLTAKAARTFRPIDKIYVHLAPKEIPPGVIFRKHHHTPKNEENPRASNVGRLAFLIEKPKARPVQGYLTARFSQVIAGGNLYRVSPYGDRDHIKYEKASETGAIPAGGDRQALFDPTDEVYVSKKTAKDDLKPEAFAQLGLIS